MICSHVTNGKFEVLQAASISFYLTEYIWAQEEHRNMGAWSFVSPRFENLVGCKVSCKWVMQSSL